jgi:hypothetical protein
MKRNFKQVLVGSLRAAWVIWRWEFRSQMKMGVGIAPCVSFLKVTMSGPK